MHYAQIVPNARITMIHNGIRPFDIPKSHTEKVTFCCIGLLQPAKGQLSVVKAAAQLCHKYADQFRVVFVGDGDQAYIDQLEMYISENHLEGYINFAGYQKDILPYLETSDVGIMSSAAEAFGRVTVEYMFAQMPVIGTNSGGTPEIIVSNKTGFLYEPDDYNKLAQYMEFFITHRAQIITMGDADRARAMECFSIQSNTDRIFEVYSDVLMEKE